MLICTAHELDTIFTRASCQVKVTRRRGFCFYIFSLFWTKSRGSLFSDCPKRMVYIHIGIHAFLWNTLAWLVHIFIHVLGESAFQENVGNMVVAQS
jgi:uncharacterized membrane protein